MSEGMPGYMVDRLVAINEKLARAKAARGVAVNMVPVPDRAGNQAREKAVIASYRRRYDGSPRPLAPNERRLLAILQERPGVTIPEIATLLNMTKKHVSVTMNAVRKQLTHVGAAIVKRPSTFTLSGDLPAEFGSPK